MTADNGQVSRRSVLARAHASIDVLYREVVKFGAVGGVAFIVDTGIFNLLRTGVIGGDHGLEQKVLTAKTISVFVATVVAWLGNRYWTFRRHRRASRRREFIMFGLMNVGGLVISLACLAFSHYVLHLTSPLADNISGNVIGLGLGTLFRFWAYKQFVFTAADLDLTEAPDDHTAAENALAAGAGSAEAIAVDMRTHSGRTAPGGIPQVGNGSDRTEHANGSEHTSGTKPANGTEHANGTKPANGTEHANGQAHPVPVPGDSSRRRDA